MPAETPSHSYKCLAPIVITVILLLYLTGSLLFWTTVLPLTELPPPFTVLTAAAFAVVACTLIFMLIERIKEIRSGEEDDLSKY